MRCNGCWQDVSPVDGDGYCSACASLDHVEAVSTPYHVPAVPRRTPPMERAVNRALSTALTRRAGCFFVGNAPNGTYRYLYVPRDARVFQGEGRSHRTAY